MAGRSLARTVHSRLGLVPVASVPDDLVRITIATVSGAGTGVDRDDMLPWCTNKTAVERIIQSQMMHADIAQTIAVILSSVDAAADLSPTTLPELTATFPELVGEIQVPVGRDHCVTSIGAACVARQIALISEILVDRDYVQILDHDEL